MKESIAIIKAINRHMKKERPFAGGTQFGVDYNTWCATFPQTSSVYSKHAEILVGRKGRFFPIDI